MRGKIYAGAVKALQLSAYKKSFGEQKGDKETNQVTRFA